jgi:hypothetical protein
VRSIKIEVRDQDKCCLDLAPVILVAGKQQEKLKDFINAISSPNVGSNEVRTVTR